MKGIAISSGEAIAKPLVLEEVSFEDMLQIETEDVEQELKRFPVGESAEHWRRSLVRHPRL